jgi:16S rRNA (adenine1518-N6/adenine1519-N6)-dimethyltransferase
MLRQSVKVLAAKTGYADGAALCTAAGVDPTARAENLSVAEFCALANAVDRGVSGIS